MRFFNLEIFRQEEVKNKVNFNISKSNENNEDFKCSFCKELLNDPRITNCCKNYVCMACWKLNRRLLDRKGVFHNFKGKICNAENEIMWYICRLCSNMVPVPAMKSTAERFKELDKLLTAVSKSYQQELDSAMVICPDKNCKVSFTC